jgi:hypothetical protein
MVEFGLISLFLIPLLLGSFITGMNLVRSIQVNQMSRDITDMYIHGQDFSLWASQNLAKRLAQGLSLGIGTDPGAPTWNNTATANAGNGIVMLSKIMWVGGTAEAQCSYVSPSPCTNHNSFVLLERIQFGLGTLVPTKISSSVGALQAGISMQPNGTVNNPVTDANAALSSTGQTNMSNLFQSTNATTGQAVLADGQIVYVGEVYFQSPDLSTVSSLSGNGVYARYFF